VRMVSRHGPACAMRGDRDASQTALADGKAVPILVVTELMDESSAMAPWSLQAKLPSPRWAELLGPAVGRDSPNQHTGDAKASQ
jgi:hypothetical protein